mmetsp:Transcript_7013/g.23039  ORF Transcript_7013/g.23039 Transcript_7013/m.23039 type:complete len:274 (-) Transcript_7013:273-1094(-)
MLVEDRKVHNGANLASGLHASRYLPVATLLSARPNAAVATRRRPEPIESARGETDASSEFAAAGSTGIDFRCRFAGGALAGFDEPAVADAPGCAGCCAAGRAGCAGCAGCTAFPRREHVTRTWQRPGWLFGSGQPCMPQTSRRAKPPPLASSFSVRGGRTAAAALFSSTLSRTLTKRGATRSSESPSSYATSHLPSACTAVTVAGNQFTPPMSPRYFARTRCPRSIPAFPIWGLSRVSSPAARASLARVFSSSLSRTLTKQGATRFSDSPSSS